MNYIYLGGFFRIHSLLGTRWFRDSLLCNRDRLNQSKQNESRDGPYILVLCVFRFLFSVLLRRLGSARLIFSFCLWGLGFSWFVKLFRRKLVGALWVNNIVTFFLRVRVEQDFEIFLCLQ